MATRIVVGLVALAIVLAISWIGGIPFLLLALAAALVGGYEFYWLLDQGGFHPHKVVGLLWIFFLGLFAYFPQYFPLDTVLTAGFLTTLTVSLWHPDKPAHLFVSTVAVATYIGLMMEQAVSLRMLDQGFWWLLLAFAITWGNDTVAYFTGVTVGRHKIWPRLSPKKTWEGTAAGWLGAALVSVLVVWATPLEMNLALAAALGFVGGILGFFGDLSISMVKRQVGAKDSGHFFPGHGGMLDRLDSMLFVLPFVYQVARLLV
ncbi:MAG: phosphatidate cytidylyltransferase [Caldilineaceae bacterium]